MTLKEIETRMSQLAEDAKANGWNDESEKEYAELEKQLDKVESDAKKTEKRLADLANRQKTNSTFDAVPSVNTANPSKLELRASKNYETIYNTYIKEGKNGLDNVQQRTLNTLVASEGGYAVPTVWDTVIRQKRYEADKLRALVEVRQIANNTNITIEVDPGDALIVGEADPIPSANADSDGYQNDPSFDQITVGSFALKKTVKVTLEELQDALFDANYVMGTIGRAFGRRAYKLELTGNANGNDLQPTGLITAAINKGKVYKTAEDTLDRLAVINWIESLDAEYQTDAVILMSQNFRAYLSSVEDETGTPIWGPGLNGSVSSIRDIPVYVTKNLDDMGHGNHPAVIFSRACFIICDRGAITVVRREIDDNGCVPFTGFMRFDCVLTDSNGVSVLEIGTQGSD